MAAMAMRCFRVLPLAVGVLAATLSPTAARAADPFYENLMRKGQDEYNRREYGPAVRSLRLACFGFLEEPTLLAVGLTRLALAQGAAGDDQGFEATFRRLVEVEERFDAWTEADMTPGLRDDLRRLVLRRVPAATLAATPFAGFLPTADEQISAIPESRRRAELERRIREHPDRAVWRVILGEMDLADGTPARAAARASEALAREPGDARALRLRGLASAELKQWDRAVDDLAAAGADPTDAVVGPALLRAYVELGRWQDAAAVASALPASVTGRRDVAALMAEVKKVVSGMTEKEHRPPTPPDAPDR